MELRIGSVYRLPQNGKMYIVERDRDHTCDLCDLGVYCSCLGECTGAYRKDREDVVFRLHTPSFKVGEIIHNMRSKRIEKLTAYSYTR